MLKWMALTLTTVLLVGTQATRAADVKATTVPGDWHFYGENPIEDKPSFSQLDDDTQMKILKWIEKRCHARTIDEVQIVSLNSRYTSGGMGFIPYCKERKNDNAVAPGGAAPFDLDGFVVWATDRALPMVYLKEFANIRFIGNYNAVNNGTPGLYVIYYLLAPLKPPNNDKDSKRVREDIQRHFREVGRANNGICVASGAALAERWTFKKRPDGTCNEGS